MKTIRVTRQFTFETAHALEGYDGKCKDIHGHSYTLDVTVIGKPIEETHHVKCGMVIDFGDLKDIVNDAIVKPFDHALVIREDSIYGHLATTGQKLIVTPYQPTCENMIQDFAAILLPLLPDRIKLHHLKLRETSKAYAEWYASDQDS